MRGNGYKTIHIYTDTYTDYHKVEESTILIVKLGKDTSVQDVHVMTNGG